MGVDVNAKDAINRTPLIYAAYKGRFDVVKLLIANGALINEKEKSNYTALHCASEYNDLKINGSLPDEDVYLKIVALLLNSGADINATQFAGRTPLILAAKDGLLKIVKTLVDRGALINLKDTTGSGHGSALNATALFYAIDRNHLDLAKFLIENGADVTAKANGSINKNNPLEQLNAAQHPLFCNSLLPLKTAEQAGAKSEESIKAHKQECALLQLAFEAALPESPCTFASLKSHAQEAIQKLKPALPNRYKTVADAFARFYLLPARFPEMYKLLQEEEILCKTLCTHLPFKLGRHRFYKQFYNSKSTNFCMVPYTFGNLKRLLPLLKNQKQPSSICKPDMLITFSKPRGSKRKKESHLETTDNWSYIFPQSHQYEAINDKFYICMSHLNHQN
ncbi:MAG: hypothetical protein UW09_C0001G0312 [candidate division TM6 bacterium GW2011_GWF2_43_87]|nr:MAG: hypothetical protein UW09_C0001G0312 [candidate division TM6 bacterium GW2011_GWF2_43_87]